MSSFAWMIFVFVLCSFQCSCKWKHAKRNQHQLAKDFQQKSVLTKRHLYPRQKLTYHATERSTIDSTQWIELQPKNIKNVSVTSHAEHDAPRKLTKLRKEAFVLSNPQPVVSEGGVVDHLLNIAHIQYHHHVVVEGKPAVNIPSTSSDYYSPATYLASSSKTQVPFQRSGQLKPNVGSNISVDDLGVRLHSLKSRLNHTQKGLSELHNLTSTARRSFEVPQAKYSLRRLYDNQTSQMISKGLYDPFIQVKDVDLGLHEVESPEERLKEFEDSHFDDSGNFKYLKLQNQKVQNAIQVDPIDSGVDKKSNNKSPKKVKGKFDRQQKKLKKPKKPKKEINIDEKDFEEIENEKDDAPKTKQKLKSKHKKKSKKIMEYHKSKAVEQDDYDVKDVKKLKMKTKKSRKKFKDGKTSNAKPDDDNEKDVESEENNRSESGFKDKGDNSEDEQSNQEEKNLKNKKSKKIFILLDFNSQKDGERKGDENKDDRKVKQKIKLQKLKLNNFKPLTSGEEEKRLGDNDSDSKGWNGKSIYRYKSKKLTKDEKSRDADGSDESRFEHEDNAHQKIKNRFKRPENFSDSDEKNRNEEENDDDINNEEKISDYVNDVDKNKLRVKVKHIFQKILQKQRDEEDENQEDDQVKVEDDGDKSNQYIQNNVENSVFDDTKGHNDQDDRYKGMENAYQFHGNMESNEESLDNQKNVGEGHVSEYTETVHHFNDNLEDAKALSSDEIKNQNEQNFQSSIEPPKSYQADENKFEIGKELPEQKQDEKEHNPNVTQPSQRLQNNVEKDNSKLLKDENINKTLTKNNNNKNEWQGLKESKAETSLQTSKNLENKLAFGMEQSKATAQDVLTNDNLTEAFKAMANEKSDNKSESSQKLAKNLKMIGISEDTKSKNFNKAKKILDLLRKDNDKFGQSRQEGVLKLIKDKSKEEDSVVLKPPEGKSISIKQANEKEESLGATSLKAFSYDPGATNGPTRWSLLSPDCSGGKQSPINIDITQVKQDQIVKNIIIKQTKQDAPLSGIFKNNGHSPTLSLSAAIEVKLLGGDLHNEYYLKQIHFHFGCDANTGSEHHLNGMQYPLEMHMVFWDKSYRTFAEAARGDRGIAVVAVLFQIQGREGTAEDLTPLNDISKLLENIQDEGDKIIVSEELNLHLKSLLPITQSIEKADRFFTYDGSLTTPGCYQSVVWFVYDYHPVVTEKQLNAFRKLKSTKVNRLGTMCGNYRPIQATNGRKIYSNII